MRARRTDDNHGEIARAFEALGCSVHRTNGHWDLTVGYGGLTALIEVKDGEKSASKQRLTEREKKFHSTWTGGISIVKSLDDVQLVVNRLIQWHGFICRATLNQ